MKFTVRFRIPENEKEPRVAWVEPQHLKDRRDLKEKTGLEFIKLESSDQESLAGMVAKTLYKLQLIAEGCTPGQAFTIDYDLKQLSKEEEEER